jgi:catechol 2,3-dioxygenase-like lactoylglutathione lyase family enzyme
MSEIVGLDHVQVAAPPGREAEARRFYGELLGLEEVPKPLRLAARGGVWFRAGRHELHVGVADPFVPAAKAHPALLAASTAALEAAAARLVAGGFDPAWADPDEIPGTVRFHVHDPWGNRVELVARARRQGFVRDVTRAASAGAGRRRAAVSGCREPGRSAERRSESATETARSHDPSVTRSSIA